jgi:hypothetical protein
LSETRLSREQITYLSTLSDCSDHVLNLAGDMLDYSRHCEKYACTLSHHRMGQPSTDAMAFPAAQFHYAAKQGI